MVFSKTQFNQNEVQNVTAPGVYQEGNLQKVDPSRRAVAIVAATEVCSLTVDVARVIKKLEARLNVKVF